MARYRGSFMGLLWTIINPLFMLLLYGFLFGIVMKVKFSNQGHPANFTLYMLCGMLPWLAFSEGLSRSVGCIIENANLVKKVVFPLEILPANMVLAALTTEFFAMLVLLAGEFFLQHTIPWTVALLPLVLVPQWLLTQGLAWICASIGVFVRDLGQFIGLALTAWMFATPIMYPETMIPAKFGFLLVLNPMAVFVAIYRGIFLEGKLVHWKWLVAWTCASLFIFVLGHAWFMRTKNGFADVL